jgi:hypothetical protein
MAARHYEQRLPIEDPTLPVLAAHYRVSVGSIQRQRHGNGSNGKCSLPERMEKDWRRATPVELRDAIHRIGFDKMLDVLAAVDAAKTSAFAEPPLFPNH